MSYRFAYHELAPVGDEFYDSKVRAVAETWRILPRIIQEQIAAGESGTWRVLTCAILDLGVDITRIHPACASALRHITRELRLAPYHAREACPGIALYVGVDAEHYFCSGAYQPHCEALGIDPVDLKNILSVCECSPWEWRTHMSWENDSTWERGCADEALVRGGEGERLRTLYPDRYLPRPTDDYQPLACDSYSIEANCRPILIPRTHNPKPDIMLLREAVLAGAESR